MEPTTLLRAVPPIIELDPSIAILLLTAVYDATSATLCMSVWSISRTSSGSCAVTMKPFRSRSCAFMTPASDRRGMLPLPPVRSGHRVLP